MALQAATDIPAAAKGHYVDGRKRGSALFCAKRMAQRHYIVPLTKRDPSGQLVVVSGASQVSSRPTRSAGSPASRSSSETGSRERSGGGTRRADKSTNGALSVNGPRHQRRHRRIVRAGTPVAVTAEWTALVASMTALAMTTTAPM
jgi:hypothetical protein